MGKDKKPYILGIDPGINGAIAVLDPSMEQIVALNDVPVFVEDNGKKTVDIETLAIQMGALVGDIEFCIIEDVHSMPRDGHVGAFSFGKTTGILLGIVGAQMIPIYKAVPAVWKNCFGLSSDKDESRRLATKLYPHSQHLWNLKKHDSRAEAVLISHFGKRFY